MNRFYERWELIFTDLLDKKEGLGIYTKEEWEQEYEGAEMDYKGNAVDYGKSYGAFLEHFYFRREQLAKVVDFWRKQVERNVRLWKFMSKPGRNSHTESHTRTLTREG